MRPKKILFLVGLSLLLAAVLIVFLAPFIVASGLRLWMARVARQQGLRIETEQIEAPFLRPVIVHKLRLSNESSAPFRIEGSVSRLEIDLNVAGIFTGSSRPLRALRTEGVNHGYPPQPAAGSSGSAVRLARAREPGLGQLQTLGRPASCREWEHDCRPARWHPDRIATRSRRIHGEGSRDRFAPGFTKLFRISAARPPGRKAD